jgi:hypothetical protein
MRKKRMVVRMKTDILNRLNDEIRLERARY